MALPPGPRAAGVVNLARFAYRPLDALLGWQARYGNIFSIQFTGFGSGVYIAEPEAIRELFTGDQSDLLAGEANSVMEPILGPSSVLVLDGPEHLRQRKLLLPPIQGSRIKNFRSVIAELAEREIAGWRPGDRIVLRQRMRALTFEVISQIVFGVSDPERVRRLRTALGAVIDSGTLFMVSGLLRTDLGPWSPGGRLAARLRAADALLYEEIARRRTEPDLDQREDVLSLLLRARDEDGRAMTDGELRDELFTMLAAGHETTATGLAFAFDLLLHNQSQLARLRSELESGSGAEYVEAVVKEVLRLRPVIDAAERTLTRTRLVGGWELPPGIKLYPAIALVHLREDLYPGAREFRPDRFVSEGAESYAWLPFGGGIRRCLGAALAQAEMAEVLAVAVGSVELTPVREVTDPIVLRGITLAPKHGVEVEVLSVRGRSGAQPAAERSARDTSRGAVSAGSRSASQEAASASAAT